MNEPRDIDHRREEEDYERDTNGGCEAGSGRPTKKERRDTDRL